MIIHVTYEIHMQNMQETTMLVRDYEPYMQNMRNQKANMQNMNDNEPYMQNMKNHKANMQKMNQPCRFKTMISEPHIG